MGPALDKITCSGDPMSYVDNIMNSIVISCLLYGCQRYNFITEK